MKNLILILNLSFLVFLSGCDNSGGISSSNSDSVAIPANDTTFDQYQNAFLQTGLKITNNNSNLENVKIAISFSSFGFSPSSGGVVGECIIGADANGNLQYRYIQIDKTYWNYISSPGWSSSNQQLMKEELLYHELGHCYLGRVHTGATLADGSPSSVMNPDVFSPLIYNEYRAQYINELFQNSALMTTTASSLFNTNRGSSNSDFDPLSMVETHYQIRVVNGHSFESTRIIHH